MKFQAWLKWQNSASHFTTDLLQMHRESRSWVHWIQQKFEEDQSFTCMMFREGLGTHSQCRGKEPCGTPSREPPRGWTGLGPSHHPGKGAGRLGGQPEHPSAPLPDEFVVTHRVWGPAGKSASQGLGEQGSQPGRDETRLGTGSPTTWMGTDWRPLAELKWGPL